MGFARSSRSPAFPERRHDPHRHAHPATDHDASLLEGLFQLAISGDTDGYEFKQIDSEVYSRLLDTYTTGQASRFSNAFAA